MTVNPYSPPRWLHHSERDGSSDIRIGRPLRALARWTLVCTISALPSFFWGCGLHHEVQHVAAMLCGIGAFIVAYAAFECSSVYRRVIELPYMRRTALIGYGTRLAISILFPLGLALDMFVGVFSVSLVEDGFLGETLRSRFDDTTASFLIIFSITLVQGLFLNIILLAYMLFVYGVQWAVCSHKAGHGDVAEKEKNVSLRADFSQAKGNQDSLSHTDSTY